MIDKWKSKYKENIFLALLLKDWCHGYPLTGLSYTE